ncbi:unnamed protein product [Echinostoma caproni]|uniref:Monocarboxylate transporter 14 n=1 Tax=Echinostoma caproni TaxID=27848 RepID=A0A183BC14_9TREM|nr:unnamed protein product [Echinostoma caproni]
MCGSGIGSFASNPFLAWLLDTSTWWGALIIQGGILLNCFVSAACFHHADAIRFRPKISMMQLTGGDQSVHLEQDRKCSTMRSIVRYILCIPANFRFTFDVPNRPSSALQYNPGDSVPHEVDQQCSGLRDSLASALRRLVSPGIWRNMTLLTFILANGLVGAAIVVPWTFIYDYVLVSLGGSDVLDSRNAGQLAWLPSLIGMGSLFGESNFEVVVTILFQG